MIFTEEVLPTLIKGKLQSVVSDCAMSGRILLMAASVPVLDRYLTPREGK